MPKTETQFLTSKIGTTDIPGQIRNLLIQQAAAGEKIAALRAELKYEETKIFLAVNSEKDENGKSLWSNEKARDAETLRRQYVEGALDAIQAEIRNLETERVRLTAEIEELKFGFKIYQLDREFEIAALKLLGDD